YPVYFAFEDEDLDKVLVDIKRSDAAGQPATATTGGLVYAYTCSLVISNKSCLNYVN
ncbi:hypothetical protein Tco_1480910, partial [Tanacetum coccineum]